MKYKQFNMIQTSDSWDGGLGLGLLLYNKDIEESFLSPITQPIIIVLLQESTNSTNKFPFTSMIAIVISRLRRAVLNIEKKIFKLFPF